MYIYLGSIDDYRADPRHRTEKWQKYGYRTSSETRSFSNVLFQMMGLPAFRADSNITMHQILRLIYLDQESPLSSLFFFDQWDKELTRETVARLLMGLYDEHLSQAKQEKESVEKDIETVSHKLKSAAEFLEDPRTMSPQFLTDRIKQAEEEVEHIIDRVKTLRDTQYKELTAGKAKKPFEWQRLKSDIATMRKECGRLDSRIQQLNAEIDDSSYFIGTLRKKKEAVEHSIATRSYFDIHHLDRCPVCLHELTPKEPGHCPVCDAPLDGSKSKNQAMRILLELDHQLIESEALLKDNKAELEDLKERHRAKKRQITAAQRQYDHAVRNVRSSRDEEIDRLLQDKGYKESEANQFRTLLEYAERYEHLSKELSDLRQRLDRLTRYIQAEESRIGREQLHIDKAISANGVFMLNHDESRQEQFMQADDFKVNYKQNLAYISNQRVKLSASSEFYLKMAARFALFFASMQIDTMLYPRFLFSDNMEDKGMEPERSRNFQRLVVRRLKELDAAGENHPSDGNRQPSYQLIYATSMLAPELDKPEYLVGESYTQENKSLKYV